MSRIVPIPWVIAGPCSAESAAQMLATARGLVQSPHVKAFRAGIWKPRTRPNSFEGIGEAGLDWLAQVKAETGLLTATEVANKAHVEMCLAHGVDILWIGARTTVSPFAVQEIADALKGTEIPVFVKNPINAELGLWIGAIERLYAVGLRKIGAIHRGFSTYVEMQFRNDPKWQIPIELKRLLPDLPLICDPSHISGVRQFVEPIAQMALDLGIQGLIIESHIDPDKALSDAKQQVTPEDLCRMLDRLRVRDAPIRNREVKRQIAQLRGDQPDRYEDHPGPGRAHEVGRGDRPAQAGAQHSGPAARPLGEPARRPYRPRPEGGPGPRVHQGDL